ncbi:MAG: hypothetical protein FVQ77_04275 [Cytophagales bacterium]|nr:hypothetical protein [Cytophagales bacterium]
MDMVRLGIGLYGVQPLYQLPSNSPESEKRGIGETESGKTKRFTDSPIHPFTDSGGFRGAVRGDWPELENVGTLKTVISQIRHIKKGETIGYLSNQRQGSRTRRADRNMAIATIAAGYSDGYDRRFGNGKGKVMINGSYAPVMGDVCMDMCMVDITGFKAQEGDEVILFGKGLPITDLADSIGTIPYEILTNVSERVKRVYFRE